MTDALSHLDSCITEVWELVERIGQPFTSTMSYRAFCGEACEAEHERQRNRDRMRRKRGAMAEAA